MNGTLFTQAEDEAIRVGYIRHQTLTQIAAKIGRSVASTGSRAQLLGLHHPNGTRNQKARRGRWSRILDQHVPFEKPTLPYVPGVIVTDESKYRMRTA